MSPAFGGLTLTFLERLMLLQGRHDQTTEKLFPKFGLRFSRSSIAS